MRRALLRGFVQGLHSDTRRNLRCMHQKMHGLGSGVRTRGCLGRQRPNDRAENQNQEDTHVVCSIYQPYALSCDNVNTEVSDNLSELREYEIAQQEVTFELETQKDLRDSSKYYSQLIADSHLDPACCRSQSS